MQSFSWISPKEYARYVGVSESTVKRWCDAGWLTTQRTSGGHRRIHFVSQVDLSGPPHVEDAASKPVDNQRDAFQSDERLFRRWGQYVIEGDAFKAMIVLKQAMSRGLSVASWLDDWVRPFMAEMGVAWAQGNAEIFHGRLACSTIGKMISRLTAEIPLSESHRPLAVGATLPGNAYQLPLQAVNLTFTAMGWKCRSLGTEIPVEAWMTACENLGPKIAWLSFSQNEHSQSLNSVDVARWQRLADRIQIVLGGTGLTKGLVESLPHRFHANSMRDLVKYLESVV